MFEHFLGNKIRQTEAENLTWLSASFWKYWLVAGHKILLPRKCSDIKFCYIELSQQQATYCQELSGQQVEFICYLEHA